MVPSGFLPFGYLTKHLPGKQSATDADMLTVTFWLQTLDTNFTYASIHSLVP
jgi:hypothetical protein